MSVGVGAPWLEKGRRRATRAEVNPLDKSTVVSIFPKAIKETKPTIQPGIFQIAPGKYDSPSILVVGTSSWWKELDDSQPLLEIPVSSIAIADSIVRDYANGLIACNMGDAMPGLFFIPGSHSVESIKKDFKNKLDDALKKQRNWYQILVRLGDALWARSQGNPLSISDEMRLAAEDLGMKNKPWMGDFTHMQLTNCPACGAMVNPVFPVCANCKNIVDKIKAKELGIEFAR